MSVELSHGLPYGGIPYTEILNKMEETDMNITDDDIAINYNNYIRSEICDWAPDKPYLESDKTRRDDSLSKSILNLRYNGTRGEYDVPSHPELFMGFMDQDNRGLDNNPRMDEYNKQVNTRMPQIELRMGNNSSDQNYQSPWTNQSLNNCRRDIQTSLKYNTKIFTDERDGRTLNRNFITNYDHNKKQLIYKDILPDTLDGELSNNKTNTQYTVSSLPITSHDTNFKSMYDNVSYNGIIPGKNTCGKQIIQDHEKKYLESEHSNFVQNVKYQKDSLLNNNKHEQSMIDGYNNYNPNKLNFVPPTNNKITNTENDIQYHTNNENTNYTSYNKLIAPITNPQYIQNDVHSLAFNDIDNKKYDSLKQSNGNVYILAEINENGVGDKYFTSKNKYLMHDNNILLNSSFNVPQYSFQDFDLGKHKFILNTPKNLGVKYMDFASNEEQHEKHIKNNKYVFTDDIRNKLINTETNISDTTHENDIRKNGKIAQEHKIKTVNDDTHWSVSDENILNKSNKQSRTSGTEDPIVLDLPNYNDFEIINGGAILGKKLVRGDYMNSDEKAVGDAMFD